jgi:predicted nucleic acid-binding protein
MIVLDTSVTMAWFFPDETSPYADAVLDYLHSSRALVPALWPFEVANVLLIGERRQRAIPMQSDQFVQLLSTLPIDIEPRALTDLLVTLLPLARRLTLSAYDAAYLDLALRLELPLATLDTRLIAAAQTAGVALFAPPKAS